MLFDLRGRGRRRTVRIVYVGLALLLGVGLVGFGVGGGFGGGGLLNAASNREGSNSASFSSQIKKYEKLTQTQPGNATAWEQLTAARLHEAGGEAYVSNGQLTSKGRELFAQAADSWRKYLALNSPNPNSTLALEMVRVFGREGLNEPAEVVRAMQIVVAARPTSAALFGVLAQNAYQAHNTRVGDLAAQKAISLVPAAQRPQLKLQLVQAKKAAASSGQASGATTPVTTTSTTSPAGPPPSKKK
jgi:hypothetical protein